MIPASKSSYHYDVLLYPNIFTEMFVLKDQKTWAKTEGKGFLAYFPSDTSYALSLKFVGESYFVFKHK